VRRRIRRKKRRKLRRKWMKYLGSSSPCGAAGRRAPHTGLDQHFLL